MEFFTIFKIAKALGVEVKVLMDYPDELPEEYNSQKFSTFSPCHVFHAKYICEIWLKELAAISEKGIRIGNIKG